MVTQTRTPPASVLLTVENLASELGVEPLAVRRLVARSVIQGTPLDAPGDWRFTAETLEKYIKAGAPDLAMPAVTDTWFKNNLRGDAHQFEAMLKPAAEDQLVSDEQLRTMHEQTEGRAFKWTLQKSARLDELFKRRYQEGTVASLVKIRGAENARKWELWSDVFFVSRLYAAVAFRIQQASTARDNPLRKLYESPASYQRFVEPSVEEVRTGIITFQELRNLDSVKVNLTVTYSLATGMYAQRLPQLARLAF